MISFDEIKDIIPHRYPMLLVDRIDEYVEGEYIIGRKSVSGNEGFFQGHYPARAIMPGVLIIEALAQTGSVALLSMEEFKGATPLFAGINKAKFRKQVVPGDTLIMKVEFTKMRGSMGIGKALATVDGQKACECELVFFIDKEKDEGK